MENIVSAALTGTGQTLVAQTLPHTNDLFANVLPVVVACAVAGIAFVIVGKFKSRK